MPTSIKRFEDFTPPTVTARQKTLTLLSDEELGRQCAVATTLYRNSGGETIEGRRLDDCFAECRRRGKEEIFHAAQERVYARLPMLETP